MTYFYLCRIIQGSMQWPFSLLYIKPPKYIFSAWQFTCLTVQVQYVKWTDDNFTCSYFFLQLIRFV